MQTFLPLVQHRSVKNTQSEAENWKVLNLIFDSYCWAETSVHSFHKGARKPPHPILKFFPKDQESAFLIQCTKIKACFPQYNVTVKTKRWVFLGCWWTESELQNIKILPLVFFWHFPALTEIDYFVSAVLVFLSWRFINDSSSSHFPPSYLEIWLVMLSEYDFYRVWQDKQR